MKIQTYISKQTLLVKLTLKEGFKVKRKKCWKTFFCSLNTSPKIAFATIRHSGLVYLYRFQFIRYHCVSIISWSSLFSVTRCERLLTLRSVDDILLVLLLLKAEVAAQCEDLMISKAEWWQTLVPWEHLSEVRVVNILQQTLQMSNISSSVHLCVWSRWFLINTEPFLISTHSRGSFKHFRHNGLNHLKEILESFIMFNK